MPKKKYSKKRYSKRKSKRNLRNLRKKTKRNTKFSKRRNNKMSHKKEKLFGGSGRWGPRDNYGERAASQDFEPDNLGWIAAMGGTAAWGAGTAASAVSNLMFGKSEPEDLTPPTDSNEEKKKKFQELLLNVEYPMHDAATLEELRRKKKDAIKEWKDKNGGKSTVNDPSWRGTSGAVKIDVKIIHGDQREQRTSGILEAHGTRVYLGDKQGDKEIFSEISKIEDEVDIQDPPSKRVNLTFADKGKASVTVQMESDDIDFINHAKLILEI